MDFITDRSGRHMLRLNNLVEVPEYVKHASIDPDETAKLPDHLFADTVRREFPLDTAGHVYLAHAYYKSAELDQPRLLKSIKSAAARFPELDKDLLALESAFDQQIKEASVTAQPQCAIYIDFGMAKEASNNPVEQAGGVHGFYPITTGDELRESAVKLGNDFHKLPLELFVQGAQSVVKAAQELKFGEALPRIINEYGVDRLPDMEFVKSQAVQRQRVTGDDVYLEIADAAIADPDRSNGEWAELWASADSQHGVKYAAHTLDPYRIFHSGMAKSAFESELNQWTLLHGCAVPVKALSALRSESITKTFPKEAAVQVTETLAKAASMTGPDFAVELQKLDKPIQLSLLKLVAR